MKALAIVCFLGSVVAADEKASQEAAARAAYQRGRAAADRDDWHTALEAFDVALVRSGRPVLHYDRGVSLERLGRVPEAIEAFEAYLGAEPGASDRKDIEQHIAELRGAPATSARALTLTAPALERRKLPRWAWGVVGGGIALAAGAIVLGVVLGTRNSSGDLPPVTLR